MVTKHDAAHAAKAPTLPDLPEEYDELVRLFEISLRARHRARKTRESYLEALQQFGAYLVSCGMPTDPTLIRREHVEQFIGSLYAHVSAATGKPYSSHTVANRYRSLHAWFAWLVEADEIDRSPMERMQAPSVQKLPPPVLSEDAIAELLGAVSGRDFYSRRDRAIMVLLLDTGLRREELAGIQLDNIDWDRQVIRVRGKGDKVRDTPFGDQAALALRAYLRARRAFIGDEEGHLWVGWQGNMQGDGIRKMISRRAKAAGIERRVWVHLFRHSWAHYFLEAGGQQQDLQRLGGWDSQEMAAWYGSSMATQRAIDAHRAYSPADRLLSSQKRKKK